MEGRRGHFDDVIVAAACLDKKVTDLSARGVEATDLEHDDAHADGEHHAKASQQGLG